MPQHDLCRLHQAFTFTLANFSTNINGSHDPFTVHIPSSPSSSDRIVISSTTTSGLSRGLLTYLRTRGGDIYWSGSTFTDQLLSSPSTSANATSLEGSSWAQIRYLFNVVTYSYTMAFWQWDQWEYILDWASLHGVNMPLAIGGQE